MLPQHIHDRARVRRAGALFAGALVLLAAGCSRRHPQPNADQTSPGDQAASLAASKRSPSTAAQAPDAPQPAFGNALGSSAPGSQTEQPTEGEGAADEEKKPRDFKAELESMLGHPNECLRPRIAGKAQPRMEIGVTANVMPSGAVRHGEVSASGLQPEEMACIRQRLEALHFAPPIENAPFSIRGALKLEAELIRDTPEATAKPALDINGPLMPTPGGRTPGIVPPEDPGVVPPADPGVVPPADPGVVPPPDQGVLPPPDPPTEVLAPPPPLPP